MNVLGKKIAQYTKSGEFIRLFLNGKEAERATKVNYSNILRSAEGKRYTAGGFIWRFALSERDIGMVFICQCCGKKVDQDQLVTISVDCLQRFKSV